MKPYLKINSQMILHVNHFKIYFLLIVEKNRYIYCFGDVPFFLKYDIIKNFWAAIKYDP